MMRGDEHDGLVVMLTERYQWATSKGSMDRDDLLQEGRIACWEADEGYDTEKGCEFSTYARWKILARARQQLERMAYCVRLPQRASREAWAAGVPMDVRRVPEERTHRLASEGMQDPFRQRIGAALATLPERLGWIVEQRFIEERTLQEVGNELGISRERVRQLETRALKMLREALR